MAWDFETEPEFQGRLDWVDKFVTEEVEPLDHVVFNPLDFTDPVRLELIPPLQARVREQGLWAAHLAPSLGGAGLGQLKLALLNEIIGRTYNGPVVFGCQSPDAGNAELLALFGSEAQKETYLKPLLNGAVASCFSVTEPQGGADPLVYQTVAKQDGDSWVISGEKWFSSDAVEAAFFIVMAVTDPDAPAYERMSMFIVPNGAPGLRLIREVHLVGAGYQGRTSHPYVAYDSVRVPGEAILGRRGQAFRMMQDRMGVARLLLAMRTIGMVQRLFDMLSERAVSRTTKGELLGRKQLVQEMVADTWIELQQFRLLVLHTAWKIDRSSHDLRSTRADVSAVKAVMPKVLSNAANRAIQIHGSLGVSDEMPFVDYLVTALVMGIADGPTEVHKVTLARDLLRDQTPSAGLFPTRHGLRQREAARAKYAEVLARHER